MKENDVNQTELANAIGVRRQTISLYANGQSSPEIEKLQKIADFFRKKGVDVSYEKLLGESENVLRENVDIGDRLGLTDKAIHNLEKLQGHRIFASGHTADGASVAALGTAAEELLREDARAVKKNDYRVAVINALLEDESGILKDIEKFLFYSYHPEDGSAAFTATLQDGVAVFIYPDEINNMYLATIQKRLQDLREKILKGGAAGCFR